MKDIAKWTVYAGVFLVPVVVLIISNDYFFPSNYNDVTFLENVLKDLSKYDDKIQNIDYPIAPINHVWNGFYHADFRFPRSAKVSQSRSFRCIFPIFHHAISGLGLNKSI